MKTLYVSDLDGTLLNKSAELSRRTTEIINRLVSHGMLFTFATARSVESAGRIVSGLFLRLPVIIYNGAFIIDIKKGSPIGEPCFFNAAQKSYAFETFRQAGICPLVYSVVDGRSCVMWVEGSESDGIRDYIDKRRGDVRLSPCASFEELDKGAVFYFSAIGRRGVFEDVQPLFAKNEGLNVNLQLDTYNDFEWLEIMRADANKASAVLKLKNMLGAEKAVCFGDNINDIRMFSACDESYAVAQAHAAVKAAATGIIGAAQDDSVALWLRENWL